jgi:hypothetical protein
VGLPHRPTCHPGIADKLIACNRYQVGVHEHRKAGALRAQSVGVSDCDMGIGVGSVHLPNLSVTVTMHQVERARICDRVDRHKATPQLLSGRHKCDDAINGEVRNSKFNVGHQSLQLVDAVPRRSIGRVVHRITKLLDVVAQVNLLTIYGV